MNYEKKEQPRAERERERERQELKQMFQPGLTIGRMMAATLEGVDRLKWDYFFPLGKTNSIAGDVLN